MCRSTKPTANIKYKKINDFLRKVGDESEILALKLMFNRNLHVAERVFWLFTFISATCGALLITNVQVMRHLKSPTVISVDRNYRDWIGFMPAVTLCYYYHLDALKPSFYILKKWNVSMVDEDYFYYMDFLNAVVHASADNYADLAKFAQDERFDNVDLYEIVEAVEKPLEQILNTFEGNLKLSLSINKVMTERGSCYIINSAMGEILQANSQINSKDFSDLKPPLKCKFGKQECFIKIDLLERTGVAIIANPITTILIYSTLAGLFLMLSTTQAISFDIHNEGIKKTISNPPFCGGHHLGFNFFFGVRYFAAENPLFDIYKTDRLLLPKSNILVIEILFSVYLSTSFLITESLVGVHSPFEIPLTGSSVIALQESDEVTASYKVSETVASSNLRDLRVEQRNCVFHDEEAAGLKIYSKTLCIAKCHAKMAIKLCRCVPFFYQFVDGPACKTAGFKCLLAHRWPILTLNICKCPNTCTEVEYTLQTVKKSSWGVNVMDNEKNSDAVVSSFRWDLIPPKVRMRREVVFSFEDLLVSFGSTLGLFLGFSILSLISMTYALVKRILEGVYFMINLVFVCCRKVRKNILKSRKLRKQVKLMKQLNWASSKNVIYIDYNNVNENRFLRKTIKKTKFEFVN